MGNQRVCKGANGRKTLKFQCAIVCRICAENGGFGVFSHRGVGFRLHCAAGKGMVVRE